MHPRKIRSLFRRFLPLAGLFIFLIQASLSAQTLLRELTKPPEGRSMRSSSTFRKGADGKYDPKADPLQDDTEWSNEDCFLVPPGETKVVLDAQGPGTITHIWFTFFPPEKHEWMPEGSATNQDMLLRIYWDARKQPGVEVPMGDFFCNAFGKRYEVASLPVAVGESGSCNCYWNMPFRKAARIEVVNQGEKPIGLLYYNIDWIKQDTLPDETPYFHAKYRQEYPLQKGKDYVLLDTKGKGRYVGTLLSVRTRSPNWFGEGDEKIYIDGEAKASIYGTGTEDYFLQAWGLKKTMTPFFGTPYYDQPYRLIGSKISCYRWHLADPIAFEKEIKVSFEHYGWTSIDENPDHKQINWNERGRRLFERGLLVSDGRADVRRAHARREGAAFAEHRTSCRLCQGFQRRQTSRPGRRDRAGVAENVRPAATPLRTKVGRRGLVGNSGGSQTQGAAAADHKRHLRPRHGKISGRVGRREARRADGFLFRRSLQ